MKKLFYLLHRKLSVWLALPVFLWAISGALHPMMANWFRPQISKHFLPPTKFQVEGLLAPAKVFKEVSSLTQVKLISLGSDPVYLGIGADQELFFRDARGGSEITKGSEKYAEQLARRYLEDVDSPLKSVSRISNFSSVYGPINRFLPAYRVALDREDGMEVVLDLRTGSLASFDNPLKRAFLRAFSWFHTWSWMGGPENFWRITCVLVLSFLALLVAISGMGSLFFMKSPRKKSLSRMRYGHRLVGALSSCFFLLYGFSGIAHVAMKYDYDHSPQQKSERLISPDQLTGQLSEICIDLKEGIYGLSLAVIGGDPYYRIAAPSGVFMRRVDDGKELLLGEELFAKELACEFSGYSKDQIVRVEKISSFQKEYPFVFRRLPVWRVFYRDQPILSDTVDLEDSHLAMRVTSAQLVESLSFTYLHKLHFLDFLGKEARDWVAVISVVLISLTVLLGVGLFLKRKKRALMSRS